MQELDHRELLSALLPVVRSADAAIMEIYAGSCGTVDASAKDDGSPVTLADKRSEEIILAGLCQLAPGVCIISEENADSHSLEPPDRYFLVDPLDGTREFVKVDGKGEFTVNIALIEKGTPVFGMISTPALGCIYFGSNQLGAHSFSNAEGERRLKAAGAANEEMIALASLSHLDDQTEDWLKEHKIQDVKRSGSSLKFCLLAAGEADVYPRFSPTMEWDTAAGHAILNAAGGRVENPDGTAFSYGKPGYLNGAFVAWAANC